MKKYLIGLDYGSLSGRAIIIDINSGQELCESTFEYPHAVMYESLPDGTALGTDFALQHPNDYTDVLSFVFRDAMNKAKILPEEVAAIGIDFTTCTVLPVDENGVPMCVKAKYISSPHAYVKLWKHHSSSQEADEFERVARERGEAWLANYGNRVSSEWFFPKILETARADPKLFDESYRFIEAGDWVVWQLTGRETHSACFAAVKAFYSTKSGYPSNDYFTAVDPVLDGIIGTKVAADVSPIATTAGYIDERGAVLTGLSVGTPVAVAMPDGHTVIPATGATEAGDMMMIAGTSGVQMANANEPLSFDGACGVFYDVVIPGLYTYETGQCCFGDHFDWFIKNSVPAAYTKEAETRGISIHELLRERSAKLAVGESGLIALDWWNGNRTPLVDPDLTGMIVGMTLLTRPEHIYRALLEALAYSTRLILEGYAGVGIAPNSLCIAGGIAKKDELLMQIFADTLGVDIEVASTSQAPALGSAIYAAVAAGIYSDVRTAANALVHPPVCVYKPNFENKAVYDKLYAQYLELLDMFGRKTDIMKQLKIISAEAKSQVCDPI